MSRITENNKVTELSFVLEIKTWNVPNISALRAKLVLNTIHIYLKSCDVIIKIIGQLT